MVKIKMSGSSYFSKHFVVGQYVNVPGIRMFWRTLLLHRRHFTPHVRTHNISGIDWRKLHAGGIQHVVFDKDNTLTAPYVNEFFTPAFDKLIKNEVASIYGKSNLAILSNSAGSSDDAKVDFVEAQRVENALGLEVIRHEHKKPNVH